MVSGSQSSGWQEVGVTISWGLCPPDPESTSPHFSCTVFPSAQLQRPIFSQCYPLSSFHSPSTGVPYLLLSTHTPNPG